MKKGKNKLFLISILIIGILLILLNFPIISALPADGYLGGPCIPGGPSPLDPPDCLQSCTICVDNICVWDPLCACIPEDISITCKGRTCGTKQDNCGNPVDCGTCSSGTCNPETGQCETNNKPLCNSNNCLLPNICCGLAKNSNQAFFCISPEKVPEKFCSKLGEGECNLLNEKEKCGECKVCAQSEINSILTGKCDIKDKYRTKEGKFCIRNGEIGKCENGVCEEILKNCQKNEECNDPCLECGETKIKDLENMKIIITSEGNEISDKWIRQNSRNRGIYCEYKTNFMKKQYIIIKAQESNSFKINFKAKKDMESIIINEKCFYIENGLIFKNPLFEKNLIIKIIIENKEKKCTIKTDGSICSLSGISEGICVRGECENKKCFNDRDCGECKLCDKIKGVCKPKEDFQDCVAEADSKDNINGICLQGNCQHKCIDDSYCGDCEECSKVGVCIKSANKKGQKCKFLGIEGRTEIVYGKCDDKGACRNDVIPILSGYKCKSNYECEPCEKCVFGFGVGFCEWDPLSIGKPCVLASQGHSFNGWCLRYLGWYGELNTINCECTNELCGYCKKCDPIKGCIPDDNDICFFGEDEPGYCKNGKCLRGCDNDKFKCRTCQECKNGKCEISKNGTNCGYNTGHGSILPGFCYNGICKKKCTEDNDCIQCSKCNKETGKCIINIESTEACDLDINKNLKGYCDFGKCKSCIGGKCRECEVCDIATGKCEFSDGQTCFNDSGEIGLCEYGICKV